MKKLVLICAAARAHTGRDEQMAAHGTSTSHAGVAPPSTCLAGAPSASMRAGSMGAAAVAAASPPAVTARASLPAGGADAAVGESAPSSPQSTAMSRPAMP